MARLVVLLLALVAVTTAYKKQGFCYSKGRGKSYASGVKWTGPGCIQTKCINGRFAVRTCPVFKVKAGCVLVKGDSKAKYPYCCPKVKCYKSCHSKTLKKDYHHSAKWTEPGCVRATCNDGHTSAVACPAFKVKPGCVKVKGDSKADYPYCCPKIKCYKSCRSKILNKFFKHGEKLTEPGCIEASCRDGEIGRLPCPLIKPAPNCLIEKGKPDAGYPNCCSSIKCPLPGQCTSEKLQKIFDDGAKWTEPKCVQFRCIKGKKVPEYCKAIPLPSPGLKCKTVGGKPGAQFPSCCVKTICKPIRRCFSNTKLKYFRHGQSWMEGKCTEARCYYGRISLKNKCATSCKGKKKCY